MSSATSLAMSRGTARSSSSIGRWRRVASAAATCALCRIGSRAAVARNHHVGFGQVAIEFGQRRGVAAVARGQVLRVGERAVGDQQALGPRLHQVARGQFDRFAGADQQHGGVLQAREGFLRQAHRGRRRPTPGSRRCGCRCARAWRWRRRAGTGDRAGRPGCRRRARSPRRPSPGPGSAARPAPANPGRWRRGTGGARHRHRRAGRGRRAGRRHRPDASRASRPAPWPSSSATA